MNWPDNYLDPIWTDTERMDIILGLNWTGAELSFYKNPNGFRAMLEAVKLFILYSGQIMKLWRLDNIIQKTRIHVLFKSIQ